MRVGLDAFGGDYAPGAVVDGIVALEGRLPQGCELVLFGAPELLEPEFARCGARMDDYEVVPCSEVITMSDHPARAISAKPHSSITVGFQWLAEGKIDGFASAGNTGAMTAGSMFFIKPVPGLIRPAIAAYLPVSETQYNLVLDVGLNVDSKPELLVQFGMLGSMYSRLVFGVAEPRVGLLSIGAESEKGNAVTKVANELMAAQQRYRFVGNVEGSDVFSNKLVDVIVTDGFVGNVALKEAESLYRIFVKRGIRSAFLDKFNFEHYGGTPVLGVNAPVVIGHGISNGTAIASMVLQTVQVIASGLCDQFKRVFANE